MSGVSISEQLPYINVQRFRGRIVFEAHRILYHSTPGLRVIKREEEEVYGLWSVFKFVGWGFGKGSGGNSRASPERRVEGFAYSISPANWGLCFKVTGVPRS